MNAVNPCATVLDGIETEGSVRSLGSQAIQRRREGQAARMKRRRECGREGGGRPARRQSAPVRALSRTDAGTRVEISEYNHW